MKTKTTNHSGFLKTTFIKVLLLTAFFALAWTNKSAAQIWGRIEYQNVTPVWSPYVIQTYADVYVRYYSDWQCTTQTYVPADATLVYDDFLYDNSPWITSSTYGIPFFVTNNTTETYLGNWMIREVDYNDEECYSPRYFVESNQQFPGGEFGGIMYGSAATVTIP